MITYTVNPDGTIENADELFAWVMSLDDGDLIYAPDCMGLICDGTHTLIILTMDQLLTLADDDAGAVGEGWYLKELVPGDCGGENTTSDRMMSMLTDLDTY